MPKTTGATAKNYWNGHFLNDKSYMNKYFFNGKNDSNEHFKCKKSSDRATEKWSLLHGCDTESELDNAYYMDVTRRVSWTMLTTWM